MNPVLNNARLVNSSTCKQVEQSQQTIIDSLAFQEKRLYEVVESLQRLESRLSPVLLTEPPCNACPTCMDEPHTSNVCKTIDKNNAHICSILSIIESMSQRSTVGEIKL